MIKQKECLQFEKFDSDKFKEYASYSKLRPIWTCEGAMTCLVIWNNLYEQKIALTKKALYIMEEVNDKPAFYLPRCASEDLLKSFYRMKDYVNQVLGEKLIVYAVDEEALSLLHLSEKEYEISTCEDDWDYIYEAEKLKYFKGKKLHKKKNHLNYFAKEYENRYEYKTLTEKNKEEIIAYLKRWEEAKDSEDEQHRLKNEWVGIQELFKYYKEIKPRMGGIYIDGQLEAFSIGSYNEDKKMAMIHIEKANDDIRGLYPTICSQFLQHAYQDALFVNREEDMGLEGLRHSKLSYRPVKYAKKYTIKEY